MEFIAFIVTVLVGFVAESLLGTWLNWPGVGAQSPGGCPGGQEK